MAAARSSRDQMNAVAPHRGERIYLDHGATSWPKPPAVIAAVSRALTDLGANPGRSAHAMALEASRAVEAARGRCARLLGVPEARQLLFLPGCTIACNLMLKGYLRPGDRVVVGSMEHNAVVRPLASLAAQGLEVVVVAADDTGLIDPGEVERQVRAAPTRAVICQHASNVTGTIQLIGEMAEITREQGARLLVDGAQAVGHLEVDLASLGVDAYAASGHKGLLGPQGVGVLAVAADLELDVLIEGGTGGEASAQPDMPRERPDRYEPGTLNTPGILGLGAAAERLAADGVQRRRRADDLLHRLHEGIDALGGFRVLGPPRPQHRLPLLSVVHDWLTADRIAFDLDRSHGIAVRAGLHCAPWAHRTMGTLEGGAVRFSLSADNSDNHIDRALEALRRIVSRAGHGET